MIKIPIIILNWNGFDDTIECINHVLLQSYEDYHIYLIDNNSKNGDFAKFASIYENNPKISLFFNNENLGFTAAHNQIITTKILNADYYKYVVLLNNDTAPQKTWLENLVACAEETNSHIVASKMIDYYHPEKMDNAGHLMLNTSEIIPLGHGSSVEDFNERFSPIGSCAGASLYSVDMIQNISFFDDFFETGYEDAEFGLRAILLGYRCTFEPKAIVAHKMSRSLKKVINTDYLIRIQVNIFYSYFKLMPTTHILLNIPFMFFKYLAVLIIDVLFLRFRYLKIISSAIFQCCTTYRKVISKARRKFQTNTLSLSTSEIFSKQKFFFFYDVKRFIDYVLLRKS